MVFYHEVAKAGVVGINGGDAERERLMKLVGDGINHIEVPVGIGSPDNVGLLVEPAHVLVGVASGEENVGGSLGTFFHILKGMAVAMEKELEAAVVANGIYQYLHDVMIAKGADEGHADGGVDGVWRRRDG